ncbi:MAG: ClpP-like prohead protease/major capsid protein fusion protein [Rhodanobacter sp.]
MRKRPLHLALAAAMLATPSRRFAAFAADGTDLPTIRPLMVLRPIAVGATEYELLVYGDIGESWWGESVTALSVVQQLQALPAGTTQINVRINSYGGSVSDGIAIYNALKRNSAKKVVSVDGVAMSSASLIAMAGDEIQMSSTSLLMIHAPWGVAQGNAQDMRVMADVLDTYANAMAGAYAAKTRRPTADMLALLTDGQDHYYTGDQALAECFADVLVDAVADEGDDSNAQARAAGVQRLLAAAPDHVRQLAIAAAARHPVAMPAPGAAPLRTATSTTTAVLANTTEATLADLGDADMKLRKLYAAMASLREPARDPAEGGRTGTGSASPVATSVADVHAALRTRNDEIKAVLEPYMKRAGVAALYTDALADPSATVDSVRAQLLPILGAAAEPAGTHMHIEMGTSEPEKLRAAGEQILLARAGVIKGSEAEKARQGNPFARSTMISMAEQFLIRGGLNTRDMSRDEIARRALAAGGQTTGDFPMLLENVLHKTLVGGYNLASFTWTRFCSMGTLSDYRPHGRYHLSSFSDLKSVNEAGEYENGVLGDAQKEMITGQRKGRILQITPEVLINDDLGGITRIAGALGQAAGRTIEKDVYALFAMNGGNGPTMNDGKPLFHADHGNIAGTADAPSVAAFDLLRQQLASQKDPGGNDFLDITAAIWLGPLSLGGQARVTNEAQYDVDVSNKFQVPNKSRGLFRDLVDTPRLSGAAWYGLADPGIEPVIEVAFLDGIQTPTLEQESNFRTDGLAWKAVHRYGTAAVGWRGAIKNPGK